MATAQNYYQGQRITLILLITQFIRLFVNELNEETK